MKEDLKIIKKLYGEDMMHLCRSLFPSILETKGLLSSIMVSKFAPSKLLYSDIFSSNATDDFKNFIYAQIDNNQEILRTDKTPFELLDEVGYDLYECKNEEEIQSFRKYYAFTEALCTFNGGRLDDCHVFFAVKKNADKINRTDFVEPKREDEYGTSVISIQFTRGEVNTLSIKNRYNHTVKNPDATFGNNLENIIPGLTDSFEKAYGLNINQNIDGIFELSSYVRASDGKFYKFNDELGNIYYCPDNIIIDNFVVKKFPKERYIVIEYFILDLKEKTIKLYDPDYISDSFVDGLNSIEKINVINIKEDGSKRIEITTSDNGLAVIEIDKSNCICKYYNDSVTKIDNNFLIHNRTLLSLNLPKVIEVGSYFLEENCGLHHLNMPALIKVGDDFLYTNEDLISFNFPKLRQTGNCFLYHNSRICNCYLPELALVGNNFLYNAYYVSTSVFPKLVKVGDAFLYRSTLISSINAPVLQEVGERFLSYNPNIQTVSLPRLSKVGENFLLFSKSIKEINAPLLDPAIVEKMQSNLKKI